MGESCECRLFRESTRSSISGDKSFADSPDGYLFPEHIKNYIRCANILYVTRTKSDFKENQICTIEETPLAERALDTTRVSRGGGHVEAKKTKLQRLEDVPENEGGSRSRKGGPSLVRVRHALCLALRVVTNLAPVVAHFADARHHVLNGRLNVRPALSCWTGSLYNE